MEAANKALEQEFSESHDQLVGTNNYRDILSFSENIPEDQAWDIACKLKRVKAVLDVQFGRRFVVYYSDSTELDIKEYLISCVPEFSDFSTRYAKKISFVFME